VSSILLKILNLGTQSAVLTAWSGLQILTCGDHSCRPNFCGGGDFNSWWIRRCGLRQSASTEYEVLCLSTHRTDSGESRVPWQKSSGLTLDPLLMLSLILILQESHGNQRLPNQRYPAESDGLTYGKKLAPFLRSFPFQVSPLQSMIITLTHHRVMVL
jgi:hypothetical protein